MDINLKINITFKSEEEKDRLSRTISEEGKKFEDLLSLYAKAAFEEYRNMFIGRSVFTRGSDVREFRLYLLIKIAFNHRLPAEQKISDLFQTTASQSKALLRAVLSKYHFDMRDAVSNTLSDLLRNPKKDENNENYLIRPGSELLVDEMNQILGSFKDVYSPVTRKPKQIGVWQMADNSYQKLCEHLQIEAQAGK